MSKDPFVYFTEKVNGTIYAVRAEAIQEFRASVSNRNAAAFRPDGGTLILPSHVTVSEPPCQVKAILQVWREEQDAPPAPEPENPAYPKRSEVVFYCDGHRASLQTLPFWCSKDEKVFNNNGDFICMEDELQDG